MQKASRSDQTVAPVRWRLVQSFLSTLIQGFQPFLLTILVANAFAPADFAIYRYVVISLSLLAMLANPGFQIATTRMFASVTTYDAMRPEPVALTWVMSLVLTAIVSVAVLCLPQTAFFVEGEVPVGLLALLVLAAAAQAVPRGALIGQRRLGLLLVADAMGLIMGVAGTLAAIQSGSYQGALLALALTSCTVLTFLTIVVIRHETLTRLRRNLALAGSLTQTRSVLALALPLGVSGFAIALMMWGISSLLAGSHDDPFVFALYSIGMQWYVIANLLSQVLCPVLMPEAARAVSIGNPQEMRRNRQRVLLACAAVCGFNLILAAATMALGGWLIALYGAAYAGWGHVLTVFILAALPAGLLNVIGIQMVAVKGQTTWMLATLLQMALAISATWLVVEKGVMAGAFGLAIGATSAMIVGVLYLRQEGRL